MPEPTVPARGFEPPLEPKLRILAIDGGGIRGVIPAILLARLEQHLQAADPGATIASSFDLISGTSTGGLIALALSIPGEDGRPVMTAEQAIDFYTGEASRKVFDRPALREVPVINQLSDLLDPKYGLGGLHEVLEGQFGNTPFSAALTGLLITTYDMHAREPRFLKPWQEEAAEITAVEAGLATSAAPTYFPALRVDEAALVDGGVFVNNPVIAATIEAMKRQEGPPIGPDDVLVVSIGTGRHERGYDPDDVEGWGALGWILPNQGEPPLIATMLDGQSDAAHHWAHILMNHKPGTQPAKGSEMGAGPRYYRYQVDLPEPVPMDGIDRDEIAALVAAGEALRDARAAELEAIAAVLAGGA